MRSAPLVQRFVRIDYLGGDPTALTLGALDYDVPEAFVESNLETSLTNDATKFFFDVQIIEWQNCPLWRIVPTFCFCFRMTMP